MIAKNIFGIVFIFVFGNGLMVMLVACTLYGIINGLSDTPGHAQADNIQRKPKAAMKYHMAHVPNPFKAKR